MNLGDGKNAKSQTQRKERMLILGTQLLVGEEEHLRMGWVGVAAAAAALRLRRSRVVVDRQPWVKWLHHLLDMRPRLLQMSQLPAPL